MSERIAVWRQHQTPGQVARLMFCLAVFFRTIQCIHPLSAFFKLPSCCLLINLTSDHQCLLVGPVQRWVKQLNMLVFCLLVYSYIVIHALSGFL